MSVTHKGHLGYKLVNTVEEGSMFGDLGLIFDRQRVATVMALSNIEVAKMEKEDFKMSFGKAHEIEQVRKLRLFLNHVIKDKEFKHLASNLMIMFRRNHYKKGEVICKEGEIGDSLMVVYEGEVALTVKKPTLELRSSKIEKAHQNRAGMRYIKPKK